MGTDNTEGTLAFDPGPAPGGSIPHCSAHFYSRINVQSLGCQGACTGHPQPTEKKKKLSNYSPAAAPFQLPRVPGSTRMGAFGSVLAR